MYIFSVYNANDDTEIIGYLIVSIEVSELWETLSSDLSYNITSGHIDYAYRKLSWSCLQYFYV